MISRSLGVDLEAVEIASPDRGFKTRSDSSRTLSGPSTFPQANLFTGPVIGNKRPLDRTEDSPRQSPPRRIRHTDSELMPPPPLPHRSRSQLVAGADIEHADGTSHQQHLRSPAGRFRDQSSESTVFRKPPSMAHLSPSPRHELNANMPPQSSARIDPRFDNIARHENLTPSEQHLEAANYAEDYNGRRSPTVGHDRLDQFAFTLAGRYKSSTDLVSGNFSRNGEVSPQYRQSEDFILHKHSASRLKTYAPQARQSRKVFEPQTPSPVRRQLPSSATSVACPYFTPASAQPHMGSLLLANSRKSRTGKSRLSTDGLCRQFVNPLKRQSETIVSKNLNQLSFNQTPRHPFSHQALSTTRTSPYGSQERGLRTGHSAHWTREGLLQRQRDYSPTPPRQHQPETFGQHSGPRDSGGRMSHRPSEFQNQTPMPNVSSYRSRPVVTPRSSIRQGRHDRRAGDVLLGDLIGVRREGVTASGISTADGRRAVRR